MDDELRAGLWNAVYKHFRFVLSRSFAEVIQDEVMKHAIPVTSILDVASFDPHNGAICGDIQNWMLNRTWNHVYDLVEFLSSTSYRYADLKEIRKIRANFRAEVNRVLEREYSGYR